MDDLGGILTGSYGFRSQGKSAPMSASKPSSTPNSWLHDRSPPSYDDSVLESFQNLGSNSAPSMPVFDKPLYDDDDDMFDGVPGVRSSSSTSATAFDDLLENLGRVIPSEKRSGEGKKQEANEFDELIPGFRGSSPPKRESPEINQPHFTANMAEDPFIVLESTSTTGTSSSGLYADPLEHTSEAMNSGSTKVDTSSASGGIFDEIDSFDDLQNPTSAFRNEINKNNNEMNPSNDAQDFNTEREEPFRQSSPDDFNDILPNSKSNSKKNLRKKEIHSSETYVRNDMGDQSPLFNEYFEKENDVWLTVSEIPLSTQPTSAPPPSRPPPPLVIKQTFFGANEESKDNEFYSQSTHSYYNANDSMRKSVSPIDELEDFAMGKPQMHAHTHSDSISNEEEFEANLAAAAAMKEAMDRAEAKFKHAKEVREREAKSREYMQQEWDEKPMADDNGFEDRENQERLDREREQKEREEREKEQKKLQRERELELERERARQAVERATREARERAAAEARQKAQRAAVQKVAAEARQRAERAAVQRAAAEARERAAAEARERAAAEAREKAAAEARERAAAETREKAARERASAEARERAEREKSERAAVERAATEARIRAERAAVEKVAAEARQRAAAAAAAARERQQKPDDDLESFFGMGGRATSAPKTRSTTVESMFDSQPQNKGSTDGSRRTSSTSSSIRKAPSATNIVDDLNSIFGGPPSSGDFQEFEGETEERRRARLERHQRTLERAAKALAEKNERDMQTQREQAERHRIGETLDFEIKRWAAGKEGNLRALLSTMQYVLWPECGWQPVSLTDLITAAAVKKVYRKATLCIHPDKVQQKGATLQQKYIAEKVFDLLKEAWNKFNSEELF